jgi:hypothetical protein
MHPARLSPLALATQIVPLVLLIYPSVAIGQEEWSANEVLRITDSRFFHVTAGELTEAGQVWVANDGSHQVLAFSGEGESLLAFGREGKGPGEFERVSDVSVAGDSIFVSDLRLGRLTIFDHEGAVVGVLGLGGGWWLGAEFIDRLDDGSVVLLKHEAPPAEMVGHVEFEAVLYRAAEVGDQPEVVDRFPGLEVFYRQEGDIVRSQQIPFARSGVAASSGTVVAYGTTDRPTIRRFSPRRQLAPLTLSREPAKATKRLIRREQRRLLGLAPGEDLPQAMRANLAEVPEPEVLPLYGSLAVGNDGSVWAIPATSTAPEPVAVTILRPDGSPTKVTFPKRLQILDVTSTRVLAVERDALDVESVVVYRLKAEPTTQ